MSSLRSDYACSQVSDVHPSFAHVYVLTLEYVGQLSSQHYNKPTLRPMTNRRSKVWKRKKNSHAEIYLFLFIFSKKKVLMTCHSKFLPLTPLFRRYKE